MESELKKEFVRKAKLKHGETYDYTNVHYINVKTKINISCKKHGDFIQTPDSHLRGCGCPICGKEKTNKHKTISKENFLEKAKEVHGDKYDYSNLSYTKASDKIEIFCKKHGSFYQKGTEHLKGKGCNKCGIESSKDKINKGIEHFIKKSKETHGNLYDYSKSVYVKAIEDIIITCNIHGDFKQKAISHMRGSGCQKCAKERSEKSKYKGLVHFVEKSNIVHDNKYDYSESSYTGAHETTLIKCPIHGNFLQICHNHTQGKGCPKCVSNCSKTEIEIRDFLSSYINVEYSNRAILGRKEIDIFIPSKNLGIEYNGVYWHSEKKKGKEHLLDKTQLAEIKGIRLIHVFEDEWLLKQDIVKSRLLNILGFSERSINARNTVIKEVDSSEAMKFLNENHIQGSLGSKIKIGLFYNNELVSLMTFGELRKNLGNNKKEGYYELLRFCNKLNTRVVGGASKLLKYFERNFEYRELVSYADRRWSEGNLYKVLGFELTSTTKPNYFYSKGTYRESRFKYRKDVLVHQGHDKDKTEKQIMEERGYFRIYDCGTHKFTKRK